VVRRGLAVEGLLDARLLLGLEERMVLERVPVEVRVQGHLAVEAGVAGLQIEVLADRLGEQRLGVEGVVFEVGHQGLPQGSESSARFRPIYPSGYRGAVLLRLIWLAPFLFRIWRRLPARQRRMVLLAAGKHGPRFARFAFQQAQARARRPR